MEGLVFEAFILVRWMVGFHLVPMDFENLRYDLTLKKGVNIGVRVKNDARPGEVRAGLANLNSEISGFSA